jgi:hypothetical protein
LVLLHTGLWIYTRSLPLHNHGTRSRGLNRG